MPVGQRALPQTYIAVYRPRWKKEKDIEIRETEMEREREGGEGGGRMPMYVGGVGKCFDHISLS